jgi:hypothetical protein
MGQAISAVKSPLAFGFFLGFFQGGAFVVYYATIFRLPIDPAGVIE